MPVTDEVWRLQRGKDAECLHFQKMANEGHYKGRGGTRQGIYVMTASGRLLGSINALDADRVLAMMKNGLAEWETTTPEERVLPEGFEMKRRRWEDSYPEDGLVLRSLNVNLGPDADTTRGNRDHVWFSAEEARGWIGERLELSLEHEVPKTIVDRLAGFHLVDNVRGQTLPFAPADVVGSKITTRIVERSDDLYTFKIYGTTTAKTDGTWTLGTNDWTPTEKFPRSVTTTILGTGQYDAKQKRFSNFEIIAVGEREGRTNLNGRGKDDVGPSKLGWYFVSVGERASDRLPPAFIDIYGADWVVDPR